MKKTMLFLVVLGIAPATQCMLWYKMKKYNPTLSTNNQPTEHDNFHGILLHKQIQNMICYDRADELKLWLDNASQCKPVPSDLLATLHASAGQHNAQNCAEVLLNFMMKTGL